MSEFQVGVYVYFGGNRKSFKIEEVLSGGKLRLIIGQSSRVVDIVEDEVTTAPVHNLLVETQGFRPGVRHRAARIRT